MTLKNILFLKAKVTCGMVFGLARDYTEALRYLPPDPAERRILGLLEEAIRRDAHFVALNPTTFFQCLWNTCWWFDSALSANHYVESLSVCRFSADGKRLFSGSEDGTLRVWRLDRDYFELQQHSDWIQGVSFSPDGSLLVSACTASLKIWDMRSCKCIKELCNDMTQIAQIGFSDDGLRVVAVSEFGTVRIWNLSDEQVVWEGDLAESPEDISSVTPKSGRVALFKLNPFKSDPLVACSIAGIPIKAEYAGAYRQAVSPDGRICVVSQGHQLAMYAVESP